MSKFLSIKKMAYNEKIIIYPTNLNFPKRNNIYGIFIGFLDIIEITFYQCALKL